MKRPNQRKRSRKDRAVAPFDDANAVDLSEVAAKARYTGSVYHKDRPSFAGPVPTPRPDASICPPDLADQQEAIQRWLVDAIRDGHFGKDWRQGYPHHVWHREGSIVYEACLTNAGNGEYHGYPLEADDDVKGLP